VQELKEKLKRVKPLIKARKAQLDEESRHLEEIRQRKRAIATSLNEYQVKYLEGVERLNKERASPNRQHALTLEASVDHVKTRWYQSLKALREMESHEKAQLEYVRMAHTNLRAVEILQERYSGELAAAADKNEQKQLDEIALRRFWSDRQ